MDLMPSPHTGPQIQGLGQVYHSGRKAPVWGHLFLSLTLVYPHQDPYPLALKPFLNPGMETPLYPAKTPSEALLDEVFDLLALEPGLNLKAVVADAQFSGGLTLRSLIRAGVPFVGRMRSRVKVRPLEPEVGESLSVGELLQAYPPGRARYYRRFGAYAKRVRVEWPQVGWVDLVLVWVGRGAGWWGFALVSTLAGGVQEVLEAWFCRWKAEVVHRLYKQNLGQGRSQARSFAAQLMHAELVVQAFHAMREVRLAFPGMAWRHAQRVAGERLLTEIKATSPPRRRLGKEGER
ncbi:hypothetical protein [Thermus arciformis]|nr:hypothetical protein [Thermus arciformis]